MASKPELVFRGSGVSSGVALGQALKLNRHNRLILKLSVDDVNEETGRFAGAVETSKEQLRALKNQLEEKIGSEHGIILDAHLLILEDRVLQAEILDSIRSGRVNAEWALMQATERLVCAYESLDEEYFRERHSDIEHVVERILMNLSGDHPVSLANLPEDVIIVCNEFNPANFATMAIGRVRGLAMESGGRTSHTAIISRGLRLPAVMGIPGFLSSVRTGDMLLLNGDTGELIVHPAAKRIERAQSQIAASGESAACAGGSMENVSSLTSDGVAISLSANCELPSETATAKASGAEGIGMYRSEFIFFAHPQGFPGMEEQLAVYRSLVSEMSPHPVAIRTLDAGAEKSIESLETRDSKSAINPGMGLRGIRLSLQNLDVFRAQIEAILRAGCDGRIEMVLPMVSTIEEIWETKALVEKISARLTVSEGVALCPVPIGVMIEVPAAVVSLESLAKESDFLCVGTNDLIQYMMAVDRGNARVAYLFQPLHPSILSSLARISEVAAKLNKPVRICGEISSNPFFAVLLLGMGFTQLSMNPLSIPVVRNVVREVSMEDCRRIARETLLFVTAREVHEFLVREISGLIPWDLTAYAHEISPDSDLHQFREIGG
ncbi:MAG TPA: phosphoenolpyruvate--protein phosphotransferase [Acidobacteriota bacterium]|nr:phosphoenolpyruvate--protein phosphotransferase [Acidobacteriota bacterium]